MIYQNLNRSLMTFKKTLLIIPYFGKLPKYLSLYFKGCESNNWLDILIITNDIPPKNKPKNVAFKQQSLLEISKQISKVHDLENYILPNGYKLCDWRPSYGLIFQDEIKNYDYWAYGDLDVIYGEMYSYVKNKYIQEIDFISFRNEYLSGSLTIIKNNFYNNNLFLNIENYYQEIRKPSYQALDEIKNRWDVMRCISNANLSFSEVVYQSHLKENVKVSFENVICENILSNQYVRFVDSKLFFYKNEIAYFHFVCNKGDYYFKFPNWKNIPHQFYIVDTGFYKSFFIMKFNIIFKLYNTIIYYLFKIMNKI